MVCLHCDIHLEAMIGICLPYTHFLCNRLFYPTTNEVHSVNTSILKLTRSPVRMRHVRQLYNLLFHRIKYSWQTDKFYFHFSNSTITLSQTPIVPSFYVYELYSQVKNIGYDDTELPIAAHGSSFCNINFMEYNCILFVTVNSYFWYNGWFYSPWKPQSNIFSQWGI